jgi:putative ABC transport system permease protein
MRQIIFVSWAMLQESFKQAFRGLRGNRLRTGLTMLGIIIGIFSVITLVTIGEGSKTYVTDQIKNLGTGLNSFVILPGKDNFEVPNPKLTYPDIASIARLSEVADASAGNPNAGELTFGKMKSKGATVIGVTSNFVSLLNFKVEKGRFFTLAEEVSRRKVAVIAPKAKKDLFKDSNAIGETIKFKGDKYLIIGEMVSKGTLGPFDLDKRIYVPITTVKSNVFGNDKIFQVFVFSKNLYSIEAAKAQVSQFLDKKIGKDKYHFSTSQALLDMFNKILNLLTGVVAGIAAISLLVGGIGIMNIMLVAVNERIREIGIRKALGAKKRDILVQFLIEAMIISLTGGILGIALGIGVAFAILKAINSSMVISLWSIILATTVSAAVGIFFGVYPAMRAASLAPVDALRYE